MSYDLYFWRQSPSVSGTPDEILKALSEDQPVDGIATYPRTVVRQRLKDAFPEIDDGDAELTWEGAGSYFQISFGHANERDVQLITVSCGFELLKSPETLNRLIEVCGRLGCALYDPQVGERFQQPDPTGGFSTG